MFKLYHEGVLPLIELDKPCSGKAKIRLDLRIHALEEAFFGRENQGQKSFGGPMAVRHMERFKLMRDTDMLLQFEVSRGQDDFTVNAETLVVGV